jgi:plastocyanin
MRRRAILIGVAMVWAAATWLQAQETPTVAETPAPTAVTPAAVTTPTTNVRGHVEVIGAKESVKAGHTVIPGTVVWLTPVGAAGTEEPNPAPRSNLNAPPAIRLVQKNKSFEPHILVVPAGSMVEFPNRDPFFHNVFSLFEGKRFDLGLYEAGSSRMVKFDRPGISYIFCNIHPEMSAVVITMSTPFYAIANADGQLILAGVPYGRYTLHIWSEGMGPENVQPLTHEITIAENASSLGAIRVPQTDGQHGGHKNKYGRDYDEPIPNNSVYRQQR